MMGKKISNEPLSDTMDLTLCTDGYWLYDKSCGMNLSMRAKTEKDALIEALFYYQRRSMMLEIEHKKLKSNVSDFINAVNEDDEPLF